MLTEVVLANPALALFLSLAAGYGIGRLRLGGSRLGTVPGTLLVALMLGQATRVEIPRELPAAFFALFIFTVGYAVGPQFFSRLGTRTVPQAIVAVVFCASALIGVLVAGRVLSLDRGAAAGLAAGTFISSGTVGSADDALRRMPLTADELRRQQAHVAVAYAITYVVGLLAGMAFLQHLAPRLLRIDLKTAAERLEDALFRGQARRTDGQSLAYQPFDVRAYAVTAGGIIGKSVAQLEAALAPHAVIERVERAGQLIDPAPSFIVATGDVLALAADHATLVTAPAAIGPEVEDPAVLSFVTETLHVIVTNRAVAGTTLGTIAQRYGSGVLFQEITRQGRALPVQPTTVVQRGDILRVAGARKHVELLASSVGYGERPRGKTDLLYLALGIVIGDLVGRLGVTIDGVPVTLGAAGGTLLAGLVFGWLRTLHLRFGNFPLPAQQVLSDLGLCGFLAAIGLNAGPHAIHALLTHGVSVVLAGLMVLLVSQLVALGVGQYLLRMDPMILLATIAGAQTNSVAMERLVEITESEALVLGFTVPYAIGCVLLVMWGPVIVHLM